MLKLKKNYGVEKANQVFDAGSNIVGNWKKSFSDSTIVAKSWTSVWSSYMEHLLNLKQVCDPDIVAKS